MKLHTVYLTSFLLLCSLTGSAQAIDWEPEVEMDNQLYPSFILAHAETLPNEDQTVQVDGKPFTFINEDGIAQIAVSLTLPTNSEVKLELLPSKINEYSVYEASLKKGEYGIYPKINYLFDALRSQLQPTPLNLVFVLSINGKKVGQKTLTVSLRSIQECPVYVKADEGQEPEDMHYMFAAYVNEDDPQVDMLLREAKGTGFTSAFVGYQWKEQDVINQVMAVWAAMAHRGIQYSSITNTSNTSTTVRAQRVRGFEDVMRNRQANCVDGSVFMCSVLKAIKIKSFLVCIPGHCFMGFYGNKDKESTYLIETTMIGDANVEGLKRGSPEANQIISNVFQQAIQEGAKKYKSALKLILDESNVNYEQIDIEEIRKVIKPIGL